jgi:hypothetical protein
MGFALQTWAHLPDATVLGLLLGMVAAMFVPTGDRGCRIR